MRANRLSKLVVDELSLVDTPADPHAKAVLFKRGDGEEIDEMIEEAIGKAQPSPAQVGRGAKVPRLRLRSRRNRDDDDDLDDDDDDVEKRATMGKYIEAHIHRTFTELADGIYSDGRLTREERIDLSRAIGQGLQAFIGEVEDTQPQLFDRSPWDDPDSVTKNSDDESDEERQNGPHSADDEDTEGTMADELDLTTLPVEIREQVQEHVASLSKRAEDAEAELNVLKAGEPSEETTEDLLKSADPAIREMVEKAQAEAAEATAIAKAEREARLNREFMSKAESLKFVPGETEKLANLMKSASQNLTDEEYEALQVLLASTNEAMEKSGAFMSTGTGLHDESGEAELEKLAKARASEKGISYHKAVDEVLQENPDLYAEATEGGR